MDSRAIEYAGICQRQWEKEILSSKQAICGAMAATCGHRWLANLTVHPHAKRCTYLRNGALRASAFTLGSVCNDTCTISDPVVRTSRLCLPLSTRVSYLSHASLFSCYRYSPYVLTFSGPFMHHHPQKVFLSHFRSSFIAYCLRGTHTEK